MITILVSSLCRRRTRTFGSNLKTIDKSTSNGSRKREFYTISSRDYRRKMMDWHARLDCSRIRSLLALSTRRDHLTSTCPTSWCSRGTSTTCPLIITFRKSMIKIDWCNVFTRWAIRPRGIICRFRAAQTTYRSWETFPSSMVIKGHRVMMVRATLVN